MRHADDDLDDELDLQPETIEKLRKLTQTTGFGKSADSSKESAQELRKLMASLTEQEREKASKDPLVSEFRFFLGSDMEGSGRVKLIAV